MRRLLPALLALTAAACGLSAQTGAVLAAEAAHWSLAPAEAPPSPEGAQPAPYVVPLGVVGEISFWAPNRGLLITGGTAEQGGPVQKGLYAWDGVSWHQLSKECGSAAGRIIWAGPDDFWTISDQRSGQVTGGGERTGQSEAPDVSLCHFESGAIVGSYAVPREEPDSWLPMTGGVCYSPSNCWFGGGDGVGANVGSFHLHWNGSSMVAIYEPVDHAVSGMVGFRGRAYESVELRSGDTWPEDESHKHPSVIHAVAAEGAEPFSGLTLFSEADDELLPIYGTGELPEALGGFDLADDAPAGVEAEQLWAAANPAKEAPHGSAAGTLTVLRDLASGTEGEEWAQLLPAPGAPDPLEGATLAGSDEYNRQADTNDAIAPEPGGEDAWLSLRNGGFSSARLALLEAGSCAAAKGKQIPCVHVAQEDTLPEPGETFDGEPVGPRGAAGPVACPAVHDCWMATYAEPASKSGWLFHYSEGQAEVPNTDPFFDGAIGVISYRPEDRGVPVVYTESFTTDDSLANQQVIHETLSAPQEAKTTKQAKSTKAKPLLKHVKSRLLHGHELVIAFTLTASARVRVVALRQKAVVASTRQETVHPGRHEIKLDLNPERWPTKLQFKAKPIGGKSGGSGGNGSGGGNVESNTVET